jgi:hypothetical protein
MDAPQLLVLGDKPRRLLASALGLSWDITVAHNGSEVLALLAVVAFDVAVFAGDDRERQIWAEIVQAAKRIAPETELVIVSHARPGSWPPVECLSTVYRWLSWPLDSELAVRTLRGASSAAGDEVDIVSGISNQSVVADWAGSGVPSRHSVMADVTRGERSRSTELLVPLGQVVPLRGVQPDGVAAALPAHGGNLEGLIGASRALRSRCSAD